MESTQDKKQSRRETTCLGMFVAAIGILWCCGLASWFVYKSYGDIDFSADPIGDQLKAIDSAEARWKARSFNAYRLVMAQGDCNYDVEIQDEKVTRIIEDNCKQLSTTISTLFARLKQETEKIAWVNGKCDFLAAHPMFDSSLGYPKRIDYKQEWAGPENIGGLNYLRANPLGKAGRGPCTLLGILKDSVVVKSLTPLP